MNGESIGAARFEATLSVLREVSSPSSFVVEIGATDASFALSTPHGSWKTVDKYGEPDHRADIDGPGATLPYADSSVDVVICTEVLEHLRAGSPLVEEISRVLVPHGTAVVSVPNIASLKSRLRLLAGQVPSMAASGDCGPPLGGTGILVDGRWTAGHLVDFNARRLRQYLARGGLRVTREVVVPVSLGRLGRGPLSKVSVPLPFPLGDFLLVTAEPMREFHAPTGRT